MRMAGPMAGLLLFDIFISSRALLNIHVYISSMPTHTLFYNVSLAVCHQIRWRLWYSMELLAFDNEITTEGGFQYFLHSLADEIDGFCREIIDKLASERADTINYIDKERLFVVRARAAVRSLQNTAYSETNTFISSLSEASDNVKALDKIQRAALDEGNDAEPLHLVVKTVKNKIKSGRKSIAGFDFLCNKLEAFCVKLERLCIERIEMNNNKLDESVATVPLTDVGLMIGSVSNSNYSYTAVVSNPKCICNWCRHNSNRWDHCIR